MSHAVAVQHGAYGRAAVYHLDRPITLHAHREGHLVFRLDGADAAMTIAGESVPLTADSAGAVSPWAPHTFDAPATGEGGLYLVLYINPAWFLQAGRSVRHALSFGGPRIELCDRISTLAPLLSSLLMEAEPSDQFDGLLYELARACFDQSWQWTPARAPVLQAQRTFSDYRVRRSLRLMRERLTDEVAIDSVAQDAGLSRPHFYKLFKRQMGITPNLYLNTLRTEAAIEELLAAEKSVTDISHDLGFASQASFTRFFTANVGIAPSEYRRVAQQSALH